MNFSALFHAVPDAPDKVAPVLKNQLIRVKLQRRTDPQTEDRGAVCDLSSAVLEILILLQGNTRFLSNILLPESKLCPALFHDLHLPFGCLIHCDHLQVNVFVPDIIPALECKVYSQEPTKIMCLFLYRCIREYKKAPC